MEKAPTKLRLDPWPPEYESAVQFGDIEAENSGVVDVFVEIFRRHVILWPHFVRSDFLRYIVSGFDSLDYLGLELVAFFDKFADAFRIRTGRSGQSLQISG